MTHLLCVASGSYGAASLQVERWSCTTRVVATGASIDDVAALPDHGADPDTLTINEADRIGGSNFKFDIAGDMFNPLDFITNEFETAWKALFLRNTYFSNQVFLDRLQIYPIGSDGKVQDVVGQAGVKAKAQVDYTLYPGFQGAGLGATLPLSNSLALSWGTRVTGRKGRGRMYLPVFIAESLTEAVFNPLRVTDAVLGGQEYLAALTIDSGASIWRTRPAIIGHPWSDYAAIVSMRVGQAPDTQRRRDNNLPENYVGASIPA